MRLTRRDWKQDTIDARAEIDAMNVHLVHTSTGSHIEPPLDQTWPDVKKLMWQAAVVRHDTGLDFTIAPASIKVGGREVQDTWDLHARTPSGGYAIFPLGGYLEAWSDLNAIRCGAELARAQEATTHAS